MKKLTISAVLLVLAFAPAALGQPPSFTGRWEGSFTMVGPDGTEGDSDPMLLVLTQKGNDLTGTVGSPDGDPTMTIEKGIVTDGKATFQAQQPNGPLFKFTLTIVGGEIQGEMTGERDGVVRGRAKVKAAKSK